LGAAQIQHNGNNIAVISAASAPVAPAGAGASGAKDANAEGDSILEIVWRQRGVVAIAIALCLALAGGYLIFATRYYSGFAKLYVQQVGPQLLDEQQKQWHDTENFLATQKQVIGSTPVVAMALAAPGIRDLQTFRDQDNTFNYLKQHLSVDVGRQDELLSVQFDTPVRADAQKIVQALVDAYQDYQSKARSADGAEVLSILNQQRDRQIAELRTKQAALQKFRTANGVFNGADEKTDVSRKQLESLSTALTQAQLETLSAKGAWEDVQRMMLNTPRRTELFKKIRDNQPGYGAPTAVDDQTLRTQMINTQAALQELLGSGHYGPRHPVVQRYQESLDQLNATYAVAVWRRFESAQQHEADLRVAFDKQQKVAIAHNAQAVEDTNLQRSVDALTASLTTLEKKIHDVEVTQGGGTPSIQVIEPPSVSKQPTRPHVLQTLALALLGGVVFGCAGGCFRDWYDYRLRSADEIKTALGVSVLGLIPRVSDETSAVARGQKIHIDPTSTVAEAFRSLRTAIYFGSKEQPARTILVTSPERGDGKSTSASNLAIAMAQAGRRVLLLDADLRAPMQDLIFSVNGRIGLANVLQGKETLDRAIRHTGIENMDLLCAGAAGRSPAELLNSQRFIELLDELGSRYDHVVIDSPPLLPVTDARVIAASVDATLLVLRAGKSNRKLSELSIEGLLSVGAHLIGVVVNDVQRRGAYQYDGSYGRRDGDGGDGGSSGFREETAGPMLANERGRNNGFVEVSDRQAEALVARGQIAG
jgi:capsular exopolysaccharide synthesis family protein